MTTPADSSHPSSVSRRGLLQSAAGGAAVAGLAAAGATPAQADKHAPGEDYKVTNGRINQSVVHWCFGLPEGPGKPLTVAELAKHAKKMGVKSVELVAPEHFKMLKDMGLTCAIGTIDIGGPPFMKGFNNPDYWPLVTKATKEAIDANAEYNFPSVICFNGYKYKVAEDPNSGVISREQGARNCVEGLKKVVGYAEKKGVVLNLEMLNTRDDSHPMKGHPGYQGDDVEYCIDIIKRVGSPNLKLLFDVYHVQIMNGDIIRRIHQHKEYIGHYHTAGNPGRRELDQDQEINYPAVMEAIVATGYQGYVAQEFIPTGPDRVAALRHAVALCDV